MKNFLAIIMLFVGAKIVAQEYKSFPMWNTNLSFEKRVNDVISRLTLEEKVNQMLNATPSVPRLGIEAYDWWNETLHGVARTPFNVTSYPQAIAMAATWDTTSLKAMANFSAIEGRAIHNKAIALGKTKERYWGLTYWTPNINIFRDPRWGRGQETYGEDPFLTAKLGAAFVRGLQGNDKKYLLAAACAKHFAVHSGPEPTRHTDNFTPSTYDMWDTYLPAFKELVTKANVAGVMCAYNAVKTQPCCANDILMNDILRKQWNFNGYVTSDCWAIDDFYRYHKTHKDATSAAVDALLHGTDVECGKLVYLSLLDAVKNGLLKESQIDVSLKRLFMIRYRLGMFDPVSMVKYAQTPATALEAPEHKALALKMAQQSIVLLRNENKILPLNKNIKSIAIVGPNADNSYVLLGNYYGLPSKIITVLNGIKAKLGKNVDVHYEKVINYTNDTLLVYKDNAYFEINGLPGVKAEYFNNQNIEGAPIKTQIEKNIDYIRNEGEEPISGINANHYSIRYTTFINSKKDEILNFEAEGDDGYRIFINDKKIIDAWKSSNKAPRQFQLKTKKDSTYKIVMEYFQDEWSAVVRLRIGDYKKADIGALKNKLAAYDAIIYVGGITPQLEGEEMPVTVPGFKGGDRTSIMLPEVQTSFLKTLKTLNKPVVFVMMTGSALATPWESENIDGIVNAWYGGQSAGTAIADVLFGDYNPSGRLPVTFYKSDNDLPNFSDYNMQNRTYRYFKGDALYPFGYGLSYTSFNYSNLILPKTTTKQKNIIVNVTVKNTGLMQGEEVVQLYVAHQNSNMMAPIKALKGFTKVNLKAGESKLLSFTLTPEQLSIVNEDGNLTLPKGFINISIGGGQPSVKNKTTSNVVSKLVRVL